MSRSRVAFFGLVGATLLVTPLVDQWGNGGAPDLGAYDPLLSEASCGSEDTQLALLNREDGTIKLAALNKDEVAFLEGIAPAGGEGTKTGTGGDGESSGGNPLNNILDDDTPEPDYIPPGEKIAGLTTGGGGSGGGAGGSGGGGSGGGGGTCQGAECDELLDDGNGGGGGCQGAGCTTDTGKKDGDGGDDGNGGGNGCPAGTVCTNNEESVVAVPEPASLGLLAFGAALLAARRRRSA